MVEPAPASLPIDRCVIFLLGKAFQRVSQGARERLVPFGVSPVQYVVLSALWERDAQSGAELTARLRIDSATITGIIDRLVAAGWVARTRDAKDRRVQRVTLTPDGRALRRPLETAMIDLNREVADQLGDRAASFWAMLSEVGAAMADPETAAGAKADTRRSSPRRA